MSKIKCYNCNKNGHFSRDCGEPRRERKQQQGRANLAAAEEEEPALLLARACTLSDDEGPALLMATAVHDGTEMLLATRTDALTPVANDTPPSTSTSWRSACT
jgi:hypothetical protein